MTGPVSAFLSCDQVTTSTTYEQTARYSHIVSTRLATVSENHAKTAYNSKNRVHGSSNLDHGGPQWHGRRIFPHLMARLSTYLRRNARRSLPKEN